MKLVLATICILLALSSANESLKGTNNSTEALALLNKGKYSYFSIVAPDALNHCYENPARALEHTIKLY